MNENNLFRLALRVFPEPMVLTRLRDGVLIDASDSFCRLTGRDRPDVLGRRVSDLGLWVDPEQPKEMMRVVEADGEVRDFEARVRNGSGEIRTHLIGATRVDSDPEPMLLWIGRDVTERRKIEQALAASEHRYRSFVEFMPEGVMVTQHGKIKYANPKVAAMSGYTREELVGISFGPLIHEDDRARVAAVHQRRMAGEVDVSNYELRMWRKDGALRHWRVLVQTVEWEGAPSGLSILDDITDQVLAERRLRELSSIVEQTSESIMLTATDGCIKYVNPGFERMTGYRRDEVLGKTPEVLKSGVEDENFYRQMWETISAGKRFHGQVVNRRKDGTLYHAVKTITPLLDATGQIVSYVNFDMDFTAQHEAQQRAVHLAMHDILTGLPNRSLLIERIGQAISHYHRESVPFSLLFIDLDGFKAINDGQGHQAGDAVLKEVARRLSHRLRSADTVARIGGDEFVVLLQGVAERLVAADVASELISVIREWIMLPAGSCRVGASVGMSVFPEDGDNTDALLRSADQAMYLAKRAGGNRLQVAQAA